MPAERQFRGAVQGGRQAPARTYHGGQAELAVQRRHDRLRRHDAGLRGDDRSRCGSLRCRCPDHVHGAPGGGQRLPGVLQLQKRLRQLVPEVVAPDGLCLRRHRIRLEVRGYTGGQGGQVGRGQGRHTQGHRRRQGRRRRREETEVLVRW
ncbi:hypothetical protein SBRY_10321 [Actinacidiphila bryophytorum]|uniref:Uncharacterized protein n=1 Tax=Actinacidiphila bryophytorum TaxID=1436133 RepID=A0A9W4GWP3_9ACTN|nr:hypothetical protein SBRY_10321 [Actinacidiphila bryophytorum]